MAKLSLLLLAGLAGYALAAPGNVSISRMTLNGITKDGVFAPGDLMFEDNFDTFNRNIWRHEITMSGGGNGEFQIYNNLDENAFVRDGRMYIRPTWSLESMFNGNYETLYNGYLSLPGCTEDPNSQACQRQGQYPYILPPAVSARLRTAGTFSYRYGRAEIRAKMPHGDWMWPAIWMLPEEWKYGGWPRSGEIDISEVRGNRNLFNPSGVNIGVEQTASTMHFGQAWDNSAWWAAHGERNTGRDAGYDRDFHIYTFEWGRDYIRFMVDGVEVKFLYPPAGGFFEMGGFNGENPWQNAENFRMAPFDQNFHFLLNVAVGGGYFPGDSNPRPVWNGNTNFLDFMNARDGFKGTWDDGGEENAMQVDYVRVYAV